ncbi:MAG: pre-peptidase C-terminal domain-containing protein [Anaerolineales bacterium]|nr:pre-peptidase C-terminal domain-containing protein [Anaerolineales bacterium]MCB9004626.1 pre-peptidase C-terminal domain-containing protein [Ardenticatenaceae bacterium]
MIKQVFPLLMLLFGLVSCQSEQANTPTPPGNPPVPLAVSRLAQPITIGELASAPETYVGQLLQVTGQFQAQPRFVCASNSHPSPVNWGLMADGYLAYMQGLTQINSLAPAGLTMTVEGRWRHWQGEVGCGEDATRQEVWYLEVSRLLSPAAISQATLTPTSNTVDIVADAGSTPTLTPEGPPLLGTPALAPTETAVATPTPSIEAAATAPLPATPITEEISSPTPFATLEPGQTITPTETPTGTITIEPTSVGSSGTATATPDGTAVATATPGGTFVTSTPNPDVTIVGMGEMTTEFLAVETLADETAHNWEVELEAGTVFTAYVTAVTEDIVLVLISPDDNVVSIVNDAAAGELETLTYDVAADGIYLLQIRTTDASGDDYAMILRDDFAYAFVLRGIITYGNSQSETLPEEQDDFWSFRGTAGEQIHITVISDSGANTFLKLYDTNGDDATGIVNDTGAGESEAIDYTFTETGLYSVRVGEWDFQEMDYTILITKTN